MQSDKPASPQPTPEREQGTALSPRFAAGLARARRRAFDLSDPWSTMRMFEQELAYVELVEALEDMVRLCGCIKGDNCQFCEASRAVLDKIAIK